MLHLNERKVPKESCNSAILLTEIPGLAIGTRKDNGKNKLVTCFFIRQNAYEFHII